MRILLVEDEPAIALPLRRILENESHTVALADTGQAALDMMLRWQPEVILLDRNLPDLDGIDVLRVIRRTSAVPVLLVTGRGEVHERVAGLDAGADDYIVKPFDAAEVLARIRRATRRRTQPQPDGELRAADLVVDLETRRVTREAVDLELTPREFELLRMLITLPGELLSRAELTRAIWGHSPAEGGNTLDVHIRRLRVKLGDDANTPRYIETVRGRGYRFVRAPAASPD